MVWLVPEPICARWGHTPNKKWSFSSNRSNEVEGWRVAIPASTEANEKGFLWHDRERVCFSHQKGKTRWEVDRTPPEYSKRGKDSRGLSDSVRHWHFLWALLLLLVPRMEPISWTSVFWTRCRVGWWYKMSRWFPASPFASFCLHTRAYRGNIKHSISTKTWKCQCVIYFLNGFGASRSAVVYLSEISRMFFHQMLTNMSRSGFADSILTFWLDNNSPCCRCQCTSSNAINMSIYQRRDILFTQFSVCAEIQALLVWFLRTAGVSDGPLFQLILQRFSRRGQVQLCRLPNRAMHLYII